MRRYKGLPIGASDLIGYGKSAAHIRAWKDLWEGPINLQSETPMLTLVTPKTEDELNRAIATATASCLITAYEPATATGIAVVVSVDVEPLPLSWLLKGPMNPEAYQLWKQGLEELTHNRMTH